MGRRCGHVEMVLFVNQIIHILILSSIVAARYYQKKTSRQTAIKGDECVSELTGPERSEQSKKLASDLREIVETANESTEIVSGNMQGTSHDKDAEEIVLEDVSAVVEEISVTPEGQRSNQPISSSSVLDLSDLDRDLDNILNPTLITPVTISDTDSVQLGKRKSTENIASLINHDDIELKKEEVEEVKRLGFTAEEDKFIKEGIEKYKLSSTKWSDIVHDTAYSFHQTRTRDSIRMRAARLKPRTKSLVAGKRRSTRSKNGDV